MYSFNNIYKIVGSNLLFKFDSILFYIDLLIIIIIRIVIYKKYENNIYLYFLRVLITHFNVIFNAYMHVSFFY